MKKKFFIIISLITSVLIAQAAFANPSKKFSDVCSARAGSVANSVTVTKYLDFVSLEPKAITFKYITTNNGKTYALSPWNDGARKTDAAYIRQLVKAAFFNNKKISLCVKLVNKKDAFKTVMAAEVNA